MSDIVPHIAGETYTLNVTLVTSDQPLGPRTGEAQHLSARVMQSETGLFFDGADGEFRADPADGDLSFIESNLPGTYQTTIPAGDFDLGDYVIRVAHAETGELWGALFSVVAPDLARIVARLDAIGSGVVRAVTPLHEDGEVSLVRGDDYVFALGREISFTSDSWPDLTGASVALTAVGANNGTRYIDAAAGQVIKAAADENGPAAVAIELTSEVTSALPPGRRSLTFDVQATLPGGAKVTLIRSHMTVIADLTHQEQ